MIFGEKFYPSLRRLSPWRQSLFALVLAQRQLANVALYADLHEDKPLKDGFVHLLKLMWQYHQDKQNHLDIKGAAQTFEKLQPKIDDDSPEGADLGAQAAYDACTCLLSSCAAVYAREGDEAEAASKSSLGSVLRYVDADSPEILDEEELRELEIVDKEVSFQVELMELVGKAEREPELVKFLIKLSLKDRLSNIGISLDDTSLSAFNAGSCYYDPKAALLKAKQEQKKRQQAKLQRRSGKDKISHTRKPDHGKEGKTVDADLVKIYPQAADKKDTNKEEQPADEGQTKLKSFERRAGSAKGFKPRGKGSYQNKKADKPRTPRVFGPDLKEGRSL